MSRMVCFRLCFMLLFLATTAVAPPTVAGATILGSATCPSTSATMKHFCYLTYSSRWQQGVSALTYQITVGVNTANQTAIRTAIGLWNNTPTKVHLTEWVSAPGEPPADIRFFQESDPNDASGHEWSNITPGTDYLASAEVYMNEAKLQAMSANARVQTAAHELGHALGLDHTSPAPVQDLLPFSEISNCNYWTLMTGEVTTCMDTRGSSSSCGLLESPLSGHYGPWVDDYAGIDAMYGATGKAYPAVAPCRPSTSGRLVDYTSVNMRNGPSTNHTVLATLPVNTTFAVRGWVADDSSTTIRSWASIRLPSGTYRDGYIASSFARFYGSVQPIRQIGLKSAVGGSTVVVYIGTSGLFRIWDSASDGSLRTWVKLCSGSLCGWALYSDVKPWSF